MVTMTIIAIMNCILTGDYDDYGDYDRFSVSLISGRFNGQDGKVSRSARGVALSSDPSKQNKTKS